MPKVSDGFRDQRNLRTAFGVLLGLYVITEFLLAGWNFRVIGYFMDIEKGIYLSRETALSSLQSINRLTNIKILFYLASAIVFLVWLYRSSCNAHFLQQNEGMKFTPKRAVVWWFVPVFHLWMPYLVMKEIWQASFGEGQNWRKEPAPNLLKIWWGVWIFFLLLSAILFNMTGDNTATIENLFESFVISIIASVLCVSAGIMLYIIVEQITRFQYLRAAGFDPALLNRQPEISR